MASSKLKIVMFLGTVREGRLGPRVTKFIQAQLQSKYDITLFGEYVYSSLELECADNHIIGWTILRNNVLKLDLLFVSLLGPACIKDIMIFY